MVSSGGVTIQKATIGIAGQTGAPGSIGRTIALPYGTTSSIVTTSQQQEVSGKLIASSTTSTTTLSAIPVARVCPQPLIPASMSSNNVVTISTSGAATHDGGGVLITRTTGQPIHQQISAINLSTTGNGNQFQPPVSGSAMNNSGKMRPNAPVNLNMPKIHLPMQPARLISFPGQQHQHQFVLGNSDHQDQHQRLPTNSPRPSILRRREGERELVLPG